MKLKMFNKLKRTATMEMSRVANKNMWNKMLVNIFSKNVASEMDLKFATS